MYAMIRHDTILVYTRYMLLCYSTLKLIYITPYYSQDDQCSTLNPIYTMIPYYFLEKRYVTLNPAYSTIYYFVN